MPAIVCRLAIAPVCRPQPFLKIDPSGLAGGHAFAHGGGTYRDVARNDRPKILWASRVGVAGGRPLRRGGFDGAVATGSRHRGAETLAADLGRGGGGSAVPRRFVHSQDQRGSPADRGERTALPPRHGGFGDRHRRCRPRRAHSRDQSGLRRHAWLQPRGDRGADLLPDHASRRSADRPGNDGWSESGHGQFLPLREALPQEGWHTRLGSSCRLRHS